MPSEDGQLTETRKGNKYLQIESHWTVLAVILEFNDIRINTVSRKNNYLPSKTSAGKFNCKVLD
jgi:hypothetical protein